MKLERIFFISIILLAYFQICLGQENPIARKVDEFGNIPCDEFLARVDNFAIGLHNNPGSQGYAVISGAKENLRRKVAYELLTKGAIEIRNFDKNQVIFVRGEESGNLQIQFWRVPLGAKKPDFKETKWDFVFPPQTEPFIFETDMDDGICPPTPFETVYTEYLNANPQSRGHIVIYAESLKKYKEFKKAAQNLLKDVPTNRLRFFRVKKEHSEIYANVEYWLVPRNIK